MTTTLVPFGKYKGQPVEVLQQDTDYCEWLIGQDWFRERYVAIHTVIVNNFATPHETPEHNALQALFLDDLFRRRFLTARTDLGAAQKLLAGVLNRNFQLCREIGQKLLNRHQSVLARNVIADIDGHIQYLREQKERAIPKEQRHNYYSVEFDQSHWDRQLTQHLARREEDIATRQAARDQELADLDTQLHACAADAKSIKAVDSSALSWSNVKTEFECAGIDVVVVAMLRTTDTFTCGAVAEGFQGSRYTANNRPQCARYDYRYAIECKPALGDDYPAVLRQMKASECDTLVLQQYSGTGATLAQVRQIFAPMVLLTVSEIEATEPLPA